MPKRFKVVFVDGINGFPSYVTKASHLRHPDKTGHVHAELHDAESEL